MRSAEGVCDIDDCFFLVFVPTEVGIVSSRSDYFKTDTIINL